MKGERGFSDDDARAAWNAAADAWCEFIDSGADYYRHEVHGPALLGACGRLVGLRVLDLGCGEGYFSRQLASRGARVTGVDVADALIQRARQRQEGQPLEIEYRALSAAAIAETWPAGSFDMITACMSLQDMSDVPEVLRAASVVLRRDGVILASVPHPATETRFREWERDERGGKLCLKLDRYFESGATYCEWNMPRLRRHWSTPCWRYTLAEWSALISEAGFAIRGLREPRPTAEQVVRNPQLDDCYRMPYFLIFHLVRVRGEHPWA